jgi:hypothetical protein
MLHRNMKTLSTPSTRLQLGLDDLLGDLTHARRSGDVGRLALLAYCEIRRWARMAGEQELARHSSELITHSPYANRAEFMAQIDSLIAELEQIRARTAAPRWESAHQDAAPATG